MNKQIYVNVTKDKWSWEIHFVVPNNHLPLMLLDNICYPRAVIRKYSYTYLIKYSLIIITLNHIKLPPNLPY